MAAYDPGNLWRRCCTDAGPQVRAIVQSHGVVALQGLSVEQIERGGAASGVKWPHGEPASLSDRVAHSADLPLPRNERTETRLPSSVLCPHSVTSGAEGLLVERHAATAECCSSSFKLQLRSLRDKDRRTHT